MNDFMIFSFGFCAGIIFIIITIKFWLREDSNFGNEYKTGEEVK